MPLVKQTRVKIGADVRPEVNTTFLTDEEWYLFAQSQMKMKATRSHGGTVFTLVTSEMVQVTEITIK